MTELEREVVWLGRKTQEDEDRIARLEHYMDEHERYWSKEVALKFFHMILEMKDQLYFAQSQLEKKAWMLHEARERKELDDLHRPLRDSTRRSR